MTEKELKKLSRVDLLELLIIQVKENERLKELLDKANEELLSKKLIVDNAGSLAEAAMQISGIMESAQKAAGIYLDNIEDVSKRQSEICSRREKECLDNCERLMRETKARCDSFEEKTKQRCFEMLKDAQNKTRR